MSLSAFAPVSPAELEARLRLHRLPELGPARFKKLLEAFGSASKAISAPASAWRSLGLPLACAEARRSSEIRDGASHALVHHARAFHGVGELIDESHVLRAAISRKGALQRRAERESFDALRSKVDVEFLAGDAP